MMATQCWGVYSCDTCGAMSMRPDYNVGKVDDNTKDRDDDSACCLVRDTHNDEHDVCQGTVSFKGYIDLVEI